MSSEVRRILLALLLPGVLMVAAEPSSGIVVSDDPDLHEVVAPSPYDGVGYLDRVGGSTAVLIGPWYVLTAGHCATNIEGGTFTLHLSDGPHVYGLEERVIHPMADIAVIRLSADTGLPGYGLYDATDESGKEGILLGYGMSGVGDNVGPGGDPNYPRGINRYGYNRIDSIYADLQGVKHLQMDFDPPGSTGVFGTLGADREVMFADGDSGGPTFIESGGELLIAGIHVSLPFNDPNHWPEYGDIGHDVRVSSYTYWISTQMAAVPGPQTGDFNDDGEMDIAFWIKKKGTDLRGVAIVHSTLDTLYIFGAGHPRPEGGDTGNQILVDAWHLLHPGYVEDYPWNSIPEIGVRHGRPFTFDKETIEFVHLARSSFVFYWAKGKYWEFWTAD